MARLLANARAAYLNQWSAPNLKPEWPDARVLFRVAYSKCAVGFIGRSEKIARSIPAFCSRQKEANYRTMLTTRRQHAAVRRVNADNRLAIKHVTALICALAAKDKTPLKLEYCGQPAAGALFAFKTPTANEPSL
jgi:hypothetical protein